MDKMISCRQAFTEKLIELAKKNKNIIAVSSDARGSTSLTDFTKELPDQFVETGIAEQNEIGIAAGLASVGKRPYVCAPACFLSARSLEQIKIDVVYSGCNVKIFGVSGGVSYGALGFSHHSLHDIAVMRTFPDLKVILPSDANQTIAMLEEIEKDNAPVYIRVGRNGVPEIYEKENTNYKVGKANIVKEGSDISIIACGETVYHALLASGMLEKENIKARVIDMHTLKPLDEEIIKKAADETKCIITVEEHSINGGLGSAVAMTVSSYKPKLVVSLGLPDEFLISGTSNEVFEYYKIDSKGIYERSKEALKRI